MKIDWKTKLSSRKFWAGVVSFVSAILLAFNVDEMTTNQIITIVTGIGALVVYMCAETYVDTKRLSLQTEEQKTANITMLIDYENCDNTANTENAENAESK